MHLKRNQITDILLIIISAISLIASFSLSLDYISWIAVLLCGIPILKECTEGLITKFDIKADLLVSIAIIASVIIGEVFAAGEIATIMAIGGFLEEYTVSKTQGRIGKLIKMTPQFATRIKNNIEEKISVENVQVGDILKVLPGESIPTDGIIINGETSIDQSTITGESLPIDKTVNDEVYSGTINLYGSFMMRTTKISQDSSLQKLIKLVESSKPENSKIVRTADAWATLIVVIAFTAAVLTYLFTFEITRSVTILVVFCPCALVLATPTSIMASIGNLTRSGILVKDGESLEEMGRISEMVFDKTGTLTYGTPKVVDVISDDPKEMMYLLASLESKSEHPLAKAIVKYYNSNDLADVDEFKMHIGKGVSGKIGDSKIIAGTKKLLDEENITLKNSIEPQNGEIAIYVTKNGEIIGQVHLADTMRETSKETVSNLKRLRIKTTLLTGDNEKTAKFIAEQAKIRNVKSDCLPEDKTEYIKNEQTLGHKVAMIGDGINDAPRKTIRVINVGIAFALTLNIIAMALAILGIINPIEGALIHNIGSVIVIIYASTLANFKNSKKDYRKSKKLGITKTINKQMT